MAVILYKRQRDILNYIIEFVKKNGYSPTLVEIGTALGMRSPATVHEHIRALQYKGVLRRNDGQIRGLEVVYGVLEEAKNAYSPIVPVSKLDLPLLGYIHAGKPLEPYDDPNATFTIAPNLVPPNKQAYVLQVKGESMIQDGIMPGDYVVLTKETIAQNGDIVVALILDPDRHGLATLKRYYKDPGQIRLMPANAKMEPIYAKEVQIQGRVCALVRKYV